MKKKTYTVSIIIPTYRPNYLLKKLLNKINFIVMNKKNYKIDLLIINTISDIKLNNIININSYSYPIRIVNIKKKFFNHGGTRNLGVFLTKGKYILFFSQDAIPLNNDFLDLFIKDLEEDKRNVAVFGKEIWPQNIKRNFLYIEHKLWSKRYERYFDIKKRVVFSKKNLSIMINSNEDPMLIYSLSNVFSCYKRSFLKKVSFEEIYFGEDILMGKKIIELKLNKIFDSRCKVWHYHNNFSKYFFRSINDLYFRLFVVKIPIRVKYKEKLNIIKLSKSNFFEFNFYYLIKALIFIVVFLIKIRQQVMIFLNKKNKIYLIKK